MRLFSGLVRFQKLAIRWAAVLFLLLCQITPVDAQAVAQTSDDIGIISNKAVLQPPQKVIITFYAASPATIDKLTIIYGLVGHGCHAEGTRQFIKITPGKQVQTQWVRDLSDDYGILSGVELWWQFEVHDEAGKTTLTDRQTLLLMDTGQQWKTLQEGSLSLYWYKGSQPFGQRLMDIAAHSLKKLADEAGVKSTGPIRIIVYPSAEEMRDALGYVREWAGGVTLGEYDLILVGISPMDDAAWAEKVIPHELTHVITENGFINCQAVRLPYWLVEGIAMYTEGPLPFEDQKLVMDKLGMETLPELKTMRYSFPIKDEDAHLAYAQSAMVVAYMIDTYGAGKMNQLVENIRTGQTIDQALRVIYGLNTAELDRTWRAELGYGSAPEPNFTTETPEPTRTPYVAPDLHPSIWTPGPTPTVTVTITPTAADTLPPTATLPATRTPIPEVKATVTPVVSAPVSSPSYGPWLILGGGMLLAIGLVTGVAIWAIKRQ